MLRAVICLFQQPPQQIPHLFALLEACEKSGISVLWEEQKEQKQQGVLYLTDRQDVLDRAKKIGEACIGYEWKERKEALYIVKSFEGLNPEWLSMVYCRTHGIALVVAETERLRIREMRSDDIPKLYELWMEKDVKDEVKQSELSEKETEAFLMAYIQNRYGYCSYGMWIVEEIHTGEWVGEIGLEDHLLNGQEAEELGECIIELGYAVTSTKRGHGYAKEAATAVIFHAKRLYKAGEFPHSHIYCFVRPGNEASRRTAQSVGFSLFKPACIFDELNGSLYMIRVDDDRD